MKQYIWDSVTNDEKSILVECHPLKRKEGDADGVELKLSLSAAKELVNTIQGILNSKKLSERK